MTTSPTPTLPPGPVLWVDPLPSIRSGLADLAATLAATGRELYVVPINASERRRGTWHDMTAMRWGGGEDAARRPVETLCGEASLVVIAQHTDPVWRRVLYALAPAGQRCLVEAAAGTQEALQAEVAALGVSAEVLPPEALVGRVTTLSGAGTVETIVLPPLTPLDVERNQPWPALVVGFGRQPGVDEHPREWELVDRRTMYPPPRARWSRYSSMHEADKVVVNAFLTGNEAILGHPGITYWLDRLVVSQLLAILRHAPDGMLSRPIPREALRQALGRLAQTERAQDADLVCWDMLALRAAREPALAGLIPAPVAAHLAQWRTTVLPAGREQWVSLLSAFFRGEIRTMPYDTMKTIRRATLTGELSLPAPPMTAGAIGAMPFSIFWVAAAQEHGSLAAAVRAYGEVPALRPTLRLVRVLGAIARAVEDVGMVTPEAQASALELARRAPFKRLRDMVQSRLRTAAVVPTGTTGRDLGEEEVGFPVTLFATGRELDLAPPAPDLDGEPPYVDACAPPRARRAMN